MEPNKTLYEVSFYCFCTGTTYSASKAMTFINLPSLLTKCFCGILQSGVFLTTVWPSDPHGKNQSRRCAFTSLTRTPLSSMPWEPREKEMDLGNRELVLVRHLALSYLRTKDSGIKYKTESGIILWLLTKQNNM